MSESSGIQMRRSLTISSGLYNWQVKKFHDACKFLMVREFLVIWPRECQSMKRALQICSLLIFCVRCLAGEPAAVFQPQLARSKILAVLPRGWSIIPEYSDYQKQLTYVYFNDPRIDAFKLLGPKPNYTDWTDKQGKAQREYLDKECLYIWLVPPDFTPTFPPWWTDHPPLPRRVFSSREIKVYGLESQYTPDTNRLKTILDNCSLISSPDLSLSWTHWKRDISRGLKK